MDLIYSGWAMTQGSEGLNCLVVVRVPSVPHAAMLSHSAALLMLAVFVDFQVNIRALVHNEQEFPQSLRVPL